MGDERTYEREARCTGPFVILDGIISSATQRLEGEPNMVAFYPGKRLCALLRKECATLVERGERGYEFVDCTSVRVAHDAAFLCRAILEVLYDHDEALASLPLASALSLFNVARFWPEDSFMGFAKYLTAWPMAKYLENDLPKTPEGWVFALDGTANLEARRSEPSFRDCFTGGIAKYLKNRLAIRNPKNLSLWTSWLIGTKKGCAQASPAYEVQTLHGHADALSKESQLAKLEVDDPQILELKSMCRTFCDRANNDHVHPADRWKSRPLPKLRVRDRAGLPAATPSSGASREAPFSEGGTHNWLFDWYHYGFDRRLLCEDRSESIIDVFDFTKTMRELGFTFTNAEIERVMETLAADPKDGPKSQHWYRHILRAMYRNEDARDVDRVPRGVQKKCPLRELYAMHYDCKKNAVVEVRYQPIDMSFEELVVESQRQGGKFDHCEVGIIPLPEPLKIRTISKGNALKYWLAKPMQKMMAKMNRTYPQMALTGEPLAERHLHWLWQKTNEFVEWAGPRCPGLDLDFSHVVSGDYKGATDGVDVEATRVAFEAFLDAVDLNLGAHHYYEKEGLEFKYRETLRDVLYEQVLVYLEKKEYTSDVPERTMQTTGQLMGSNLSFPILCIINLCGFWLALEEYTGLMIEPYALPVLINGDDILFRSPAPNPDNPSSFYELWKKHIAWLGFELSVGKNYIHRSIFTVNSEVWERRGDHAAPQFRRYRHLDVGLLTNHNASSRLENRTLPLADRIQRVLEGAHNKPRAWRRLKHYYRTELKEWMQVGRWTTFNVFAAVPLGGLGVDPLGIDPGFSKFQLRLASFLRKRMADITCTDQLRSCEAIQLATERENKGLCYIRPKGGQRVQWVTREVFEENRETMEVRKDLRTMPVLSKEGTITRSSWVKKFSTRSLKLFRSALYTNVLGFDKNPTKFDLVMARHPVTENSFEISPPEALTPDEWTKWSASVREDGR